MTSLSRELSQTRATIFLGTLGNISGFLVKKSSL